MDASQAAAAQLRSLEQTMICPKLLEQQLAAGMPSTPAVVVTKASEDPVLQKLLAPIREHKQRGAELFLRDTDFCVICSGVRPLGTKQP